MSNLKEFIKNPRLFFQVVLSHLSPLIKDDATFIKMMWKLNMNYPLNLKNPKTFSEKLQWMKLYDRKSEYTLMVDKYAVKKYVADIIGEEYIIPTLGVWDRVEDIEWDKLPNKFVLKCTHDSGGLVICRDKQNLDKKVSSEKLRFSLNRDYYMSNREWPYKNVPRRIIAEKYIEPTPELNDLPDYKFFCFNGEPKFCQVISGRQTRMCIDFFDREWKHQPFHEPKEFPFATTKLEKPKNYDIMLNLASKLAFNKSFSRIDFYDIDGKIYFGEITFYPTSGIGGFEPEEWDYTFGEWITLPTLKS